MTYSNELFKLPQTWRNIIKKLESTKTKLVKAKWSSIFNDICLKEKLLPNYTRIIYKRKRHTARELHQENRKNASVSCIN